MTHSNLTAREVLMRQREGEAKFARMIAPALHSLQRRVENLFLLAWLYETPRVNADAENWE